jgi:predicted nucleotidyltransferase
LASTVPALDCEAVLRELAGKGFQFLLIGVGALAYHGYIRAAPEIEIIPAPDPENLERLAQALRGLGAHAQPEGRAPQESLITRFDCLRLVQRIEDLHLWEELSPAPIEDSIGDLPIKVVSYEDLVPLKELAGRPEDLVDLQRLREAREG